MLLNALSYIFIIIVPQPPETIKFWESRSVRSIVGIKRGPIGHAKDDPDLADLIAPRSASRSG